RAADLPEAGLVRGFLDSIAADAGIALPELPADLPLPEALERIRAAGHLAGIETAELLRRFEVFRINTGAQAEDRPGRHEGPVHLVEASSSPGLAERWRPFCGSLAVHPMAGDHHTLLRGSSTPLLVTLLESLFRPPPPAGTGSASPGR